MPTLAEKEAEYQRGALSKQQIYQARNQARGTCHSCSKPVAFKWNGQPDTRCAFHREEGRRLQRIQYALDNPGAKQVVCGQCGESGHNRRTCSS